VHKASASDVDAIELSLLVTWLLAQSATYVIAGYSQPHCHMAACAVCVMCIVD
jgi:hypothetical protein